LADASTTATVLTSLGIGGLLGSVARSRHERSEKFRDRTIESCRDWLKAHNVVRRKLRSLETQLMTDDPSGVREDRAALDRSLSEIWVAWRELETQTFLVALLLAGGTNAPAAQNAQALVLCYDRWYDRLVELIDGTIDRDTARWRIDPYQELAKVAYNKFVTGVNEAIRPSAPWRRGPQGDSNPLEEVAKLDRIARANWA
jgi:hypothetical protein